MAGLVTANRSDAMMAKSPHFLPLAQGIVAPFAPKWKPDWLKKARPLNNLG
jgi:hypothetical protein